MSNTINNDQLIQLLNHVMDDNARLRNEVETQKEMIRLIHRKNADQNIEELNPRFTTGTNPDLDLKSVVVEPEVGGAHMSAEAMEKFSEDKIWPVEATSQNVDLEIDQETSDAIPDFKDLLSTDENLASDLENAFNKGDSESSDKKKEVSLDDLSFEGIPNNTKLPKVREFAELMGIYSGKSWTIRQISEITGFSYNHVDRVITKNKLEPFITVSNGSTNGRKAKAFSFEDLSMLFDGVFDPAVNYVNVRQLPGIVDLPMHKQNKFNTKVRKKAFEKNSQFVGTGSSVRVAQWLAEKEAEKFLNHLNK